MITINIKTQTLTHQGKTYTISSAKNGVGEVEGSECTPSGKHKICAKIGDSNVIGSVFVARESTGEIYSGELAKQHPNRDWILSRILWLDGCEDFNQNTKARYIYIHGTPDDTKLGMVGSKGCIRMNNNDIVELFNQVEKNDLVAIE